MTRIESGCAPDYFATKEATVPARTVAFFVSIPVDAGGKGGGAASLKP